MSLDLQTVICSTRPGRVGPSVARWFHEFAVAHGKFDAKLIDLCDFGLPLYNEPDHPRQQARQRIVDVDDIIAFHGESVSEFESNFHTVVDSYISACEKLGTAPEKPASGRVMLRVSPNVHAAALKAAARKGVSLNKWAEQALSAASRKSGSQRASRNR